MFFSEKISKLLKDVKREKRQAERRAYELAQLQTILSAAEQTKHKDFARHSIVEVEQRFKNMKASPSDAGRHNKKRI